MIRSALRVCLYRNSRSTGERSCHSIATIARKQPHMGLTPEKQVASFENQYYRRQLEKRQPPVAPVLIPESPACLQKLQEICDNMGSIEIPEFDEFAAELAQQIPRLPRESVIHILNLLAKSPRHPTMFKNRSLIWLAIDSVLIRDHKRSERSPEILRQSLDDALLMCMANPGRIPNLAINLSGSFVKRIQGIDLDRDRLLVLLFILNLSRNPLPLAAARNLEQKVLSFIDQMTIDDIGLVSIAFFKTQTKIRDPALVTKIVDVAMTKEIRKPDHVVSLSSVLKVLKNQLIPETVDRVRTLIDTFSKDELMQMTPMAINHLCRLATAYHKYSPILMGCTVEALSRNIQDGYSRVRFKDVVEILRSCDNFGFSPDAGLMHQILSGWPTSDEMYEYPRFFISYLSLLASMGYFPEQLIEKCFSFKFLKHAKECCDLFPYIDLLMLHTILSIDCHPQFSGNLLRPEEIDDAIRRIGRVDVALVMDKRSQPASYTDVQMKRLFWVCKGLYGARIAYAFILPYMKYPEIVLLGEGQDIEWLKTRPLIPGSFSGSKCIIVCTRQHYADSQSQVQRNFYSRKKQLLRKLGFNLMEIHFSELSNMSDQNLNKLLAK